MTGDCFRNSCIHGLAPLGVRETMRKYKLHPLIIKIFSMTNDTTFWAYRLSWKIPRETSPFDGSQRTFVSGKPNSSIVSTLESHLWIGSHRRGHRCVPPVCQGASHHNRAGFMYSPARIILGTLDAEATSNVKREMEKRQPVPFLSTIPSFIS
jgi:hypothetical protein